MAIHRQIHTQNYTVLDNKIIRGKELSSTAKMVLAICLSLPDDWQFNIRGLCTFCAEGPDAVANALKELEKYKYIKRRRVRDNNGKITGMEYDIYEHPQPVGKPNTKNPDQENPDMVEPDVEVPYLEQEVLPNTNLPSKKESNTYGINNQSIDQIEAIEEKIRMQIEYEIMRQRYDSRLLDNIVSTIVSAIVAKEDIIAVGKDKSYPAEYVRSCLSKVGPLHIEQLMETLIRNEPTIRNVRAYLLTALINAVNTMDMGYQYGKF